MREVIVYSRSGCHLCEAMLAEVEPLCRGRARLVVRDVDDREDWVERYGVEVPVLIVGGQEVCRYEFDLAAFRRALDESNP